MPLLPFSSGYLHCFRVSSTISMAISVALVKVFSISTHSHGLLACSFLGERRSPTCSCRFVTHLHSLIYYVSFLVFPFETETDEEDKAMDIVEALDFEDSQTPSGETIDHEKIVELSESRA